jgi:hypothetical protein
MTHKPIMPENINAQLREHALALTDWEQNGAAALFHEWAERFNLEFKLDLPTPAIRIERIAHSHLGAYRQARNGFGLAHEVTMNSRHLDRPLWQQLATLFHEELHAWQYLYNKPGENNYHNVPFRRKAGMFGLVIDERGRHLGILPGRFTELLSAHGVDMSTLPEPVVEGPAPMAARLRGESKMRKYRCGCTTVRCAVELAAQCLKCRMDFEEAPPAW